MKQDTGAGEFKKRGKPAAQLVPIEEQRPAVFGRLTGSVKFMGDIISPVDAEWDANKDDDEPNDPAGYSLLDLDTGRGRK
jgi:antitoxin (DNA-binding transcriptional repressor) of toxin-antitoxin stability system